MTRVTPKQASVAVSDKAANQMKQLTAKLVNWLTLQLTGPRPDYLYLLDSILLPNKQ